MSMVRRFRLRPRNGMGAEEFGGNVQAESRASPCGGPTSSRCTDHAGWWRATRPR
jgi:hypothetical protein